MNDNPTPNPDAESAARRKKAYKKSLNLPRTSFPMRANLRQNEPASLERWRRMDLYPRVVERARERGGEPFVFHDGPPYANGSIHVGHLLNKVLKDFVVRSRNMAGRPCPFVPGWDCHGLPIEHRVMSELLASGKLEAIQALDDDRRRMAIRRACARYAGKYKGIQSSQIERLLTLADYDDPYLTMTPAYERAVLEVFAELLDQGLVYRALKPVHWSIANQTALAEAELEYRERRDPSVYVAFEADSPAAVAAAFGVRFDPGDPAPAFLIWTTTPWTLPANMLIAVEPGFRYALVRAGDRLLVIARQRLEAVAAAAGFEPAIVAETDGASLVGLTYRHPLHDWPAFPDHRGRIVAADYVTVDDGTGLVHTATGHGHEDFETGLREGVPVYCPVRADGTYDDTVPEWLRGVEVWEANRTVVERLRASGHLLYDEPYVHSYPHDWRSKTPVIFRCTEQWFIAVDRPTRRDRRSLRQLALAAIDDVRFVPGWGYNRLRGMLEARPDWCISRQRAWGLPIPAFRCPDGSLLLTAASVRAVAEVVAAEGSDAWFTRAPAELLAAYDPAQDPQAPPGLVVGELRKTYDIFDVWFESGSSWNAVMRQRELGYPCDLYLEGSDQHRGWFQTSLLPALGATGQAPFRSLLTHGFMVDKEGRKMSKSVGNTLEVEDLLARFGADVCRWWVSSLAYENEMKVDLSFFEVAGESYRKVRNTLRFLLSNLADFTPQDGVDLATLPPTSLDAYALAAASELRRQVLEAYERFAFRRAHLLLYDFTSETLSSFYLDAVKDRLYCDRPDSARRRATQSVMWRLVELLTTLLAPILPHTADEAWRSLKGDEACVHLEPFAALDHRADPGWERVVEVRGTVRKALEEAKAGGLDNPLDAGVVVADPDGRLAPFAGELADVFGVSRVALAAEGPAVEIQDLRGEPRCERSWRRDATVALRRDGGWLSDRDAEVLGLL
ncbi:MAG: isoleucine--tRNA ligase [Acidobacteria bacterium]|nr:MAG: isoleucine--tRNA ligase [Acidobacteriota bacterium]